MENLTRRAAALGAMAAAILPISPAARIAAFVRCGFGLEEACAAVIREPAVEAVAIRLLRARGLG